jgi:predicted PurR-regulated permease PerM
MKDSVHTIFVLLVTLAISVLFFIMIRGFFLAIFFAALFSGIAWPFNQRVAAHLKGRKGMASMITLLLFSVVVLLPVIGFFGILVNQAIEAGKSYGPWIRENLSTENHFARFLEHFPLIQRIYPEQQELVARIDQAIGQISEILVAGLSTITQGTVNFFFLLFVFLYSMYFFLKDGNKILAKILYYFPLRDDEEQQLLEKFTKVTRATLKGTFIIGLLQGGLAGIAMALAGVPYTVFWGTVMAVLSIIPAIGPALVWLPAGIILLISGQTFAGIALIVFCAVVVGNVDNVLRPILVGKDTQMPELMIFFGTLGGIALFGISGIVLGPLVAAVFLTIWPIYGETFKDILPEVPAKTAKDSMTPPST